MIDYGTIIAVKYPGKQYTQEGLKYSGITWLDGVPISKAKLDSQYKAHRLAVAYIKQRKEAYPKIEDQLDIIYHEGLEVWKAKIGVIKAKYPKPE